MRNYFTLGGVDSRNYGVYISGSGVFDAPARNVEFYSVPGRDGDLIGMQTRLQNMELTYPAFIYADFDANLSGLKGLLLQTNAFRRLIDSYHPDEYRMAVYTGPMEIKPTRRLNAGKFDIRFNVMPQRFLLSGDTPQAFTAAGTIENPTPFAAKPLIRVYGNGVLGVGAESVTIINNAGNYIDLDSATGMAMRGVANMNSSVNLSGTDFPTLPAGETGISLGTGITRVEITPRWWQL
jgi:phage-related protein